MSLSGKIHVGGLVPFSSKDFPGYLSAVIFLQGCPWRCVYCHNPHLIPCRNTEEIPFEQVESFLEIRRGLLDAVVFSGGEPTLQPALPEVLEVVKKMGFKIGLHTNGAFPDRLKLALPWVDWVAIDAKTNFWDYADITGNKESGSRVKESLQLVVESGLSHEVRTTVFPSLHSSDLLLNLGQKLATMGVRHYAIQVGRLQGMAADSYSANVKHQSQAFHLESGVLQKLSPLFETFNYRCE